MTITQTINIPANRRIFLDLPSELPIGRAQVEFRVISFPDQEKMSANAYEATLNLRGLAKKMGSTLTVESFHKMMRDDKTLEDEQYDRLVHKKD